MVDELENAIHFRVIAGTHSAYGGPHSPEAHGLKIIKHPNYTISEKNADIALIKLDKSFRFNDRIKPIELSDRETARNTMCLVSGWGATGGKAVLTKLTDFTNGFLSRP